ncbi:MAG: hypothetical protein ACK5U7_10255, partial [Bacteroidota bacterium]
MVFQPSRQDENSVLAFEIKEYRRDSMGNMRLVGSSFHERTLITTIKGGNNPPTITLSSDVTICAGDQRCYAVKLEDKPFKAGTPPDTLRWRWISNHPNVNVSSSQTLPNEVNLSVCITTSASDSLGSSYFFSIIADDNSCTTPRKPQRTQHIRVLRKPEFNFKASKLPGSRVVLQLSSRDSTAEYSVAFRGPDKFFRRYDYRRKTSVSDTIQFPLAGTYYIEAEIKVPNACSYLLRDSIQLEGCLKLEPLSVPL